MSVERKTAWKALDFPAAQRDEELCMLSDKDFLKQFTNTLRSCLMIRKLSTPCKVFVTERITLKSHTQVAPSRLASLQEQPQKATQK